MEMSIRTMMVIVIGIIAMILIIALFVQGQTQGASMLEGIFDWFKILGAGS